MPHEKPYLKPASFKVRSDSAPVDDAHSLVHGTHLTRISLPDCPHTGAYVPQSCGLFSPRVYEKTLGNNLSLWLP